MLNVILIGTVNWFIVFPKWRNCRLAAYWCFCLHDSWITFPVYVQTKPDRTKNYNKILKTWKQRVKRVASHCYPFNQCAHLLLARAGRPPGAWAVSGRRCTAGQYRYVPLGRHLVYLSIMQLPFISGNCLIAGCPCYQLDPTCKLSWTFLFTQSFDDWRTVTFVVTCPRSVGLRQAKY